MDLQSTNSGTLPTRLFHMSHVIRTAVSLLILCLLRSFLLALDHLQSRRHLQLRIAQIDVSGATVSAIFYRNALMFSPHFRLARYFSTNTIIWSTPSLVKSLHPCTDVAECKFYYENSAYSHILNSSNHRLYFHLLGLRLRSNSLTDYSRNPW